MSNKNLLKTVGIGVVLVAVLVGLSATIDRSEIRPTSETGVSQIVEVTLTIDGLYADKEMSITSDETVLDLLKTLDEENAQVQLRTKEYPGMGTLVESIGGKTNGEEDKYWQYTVNGVMPQVAADALVVQNGDNIEWKFTPSEY